MTTLDEFVELLVQACASLAHEVPPIRKSAYSTRGSKDPWVFAARVCINAGIM